MFQGGTTFVPHEIKTFQRKGDLVRSEYERLNPDGTVTKSVAYGDCKEGLRYRTFQMGLDGAVREISSATGAPEHFRAKPVSAAPRYQVPAPRQQESAPRYTQTAPRHQEPTPRYHQEPTPRYQQTAPRYQEPTPRYQQTAPRYRELTPQQQPEPQEKPRKTLAYIVERTDQPDQAGSTWKVRPLKIKEEKPAAAETSSHKDVPWWYEPLKEALREGPKEEKIPEKLPEEPKRKPLKNIFDIFDNDFFSFNPFARTAVHSPRWTSPFDTFLGGSIFDQPRLGSRSLLDDF